MEKWLDTLKTNTPQEGFELAIKMARMGVKYTQPSAEVRDKLREPYANNADSLTLASQGAYIFLNPLDERESRTPNLDDVVKNNGRAKPVFVRYLVT